MNNNTTIQLGYQKELVDEVDEIVGKRGYKSRVEFVKEAVRAKLDEAKRLSSLSTV